MDVRIVNNSSKLHICVSKIKNDDIMFTNKICILKYDKDTLTL